MSATSTVRRLLAEGKPEVARAEWQRLSNAGLATPGELEELQFDLALASGVSDPLGGPLALGGPALRNRVREFLLGMRRFDAVHRLIQQVPADGTDAQVDRAVLAQLGGDFARAAQLCSAVLAQHPQHAYAANGLGRALFNLGRIDDAQRAFAAAAAARQPFPEALNNLGHVLRHKGDLDAARQAFSQAVLQAPAFLPARSNRATVLMAQRQPDAALVDLQAVLQRDPGDFDAQLNAGMCLHLRRDYAAAEAAYRAASAIQPGHPLPHRQLAKLCNELGDSEGAVRHFEQAIAIDGNNPELLAEHLSALELANRVAPATALAAEYLRRFPRHPQLSLEAAKLERRAGNAQDGLARLRSIDPQQIPPPLRQWFFFELGTALDRNGEAAAAYQAYCESNRLAASGARAQLTDKAAFPRVLAALEDWIEQGAPVQRYEEHEDLGADLTFLLGFPRSGTTLLDLMLDRHPEVASLEEKQTIELVFHEVDQKHGGFPHGFSALDAPRRERLRARYRATLAEFGIASPSTQHIIDKMPIRTPYVAFIHRLFPRARFVFSVRHPCDVVLSNFMQLYAANDVFVNFYTLASSASTYDRVMAIWQKTTALLPPEAFHYVRYEQLVQAPQQALADVCGFLGLGFDPSMTEHTRTLETRERIRTNSYHQVAEPLYTRSLERWRSYQPQFAEVMPLLERHLQYFGYA
jgi:tetratricopeptide (TPR) repeat protein